MDSKLIQETVDRLHAEKRRIQKQIAAVVQQMPGHIPDHDLERYHLGMVKDAAELARLEEHLPGCASCLERAEKAAEYVDAMRAAAAADDRRLDPA
jgi:hypothetical protein